MLLGAKAYFQEGRRIIYSFYFLHVHAFGVNWREGGCGKKK